MSHRSMESCLGLSDDLCGVTGDQSFGEAISSGKLINSEVFQHKMDFYKSYIHLGLQQIEKIELKKSRNLDEIKQAWDLLHKVKTEQECDQLGKLLAKKETKEILREINFKIYQDYNLGQYVFKYIRTFFMPINKTAEMSTGYAENSNQIQDSGEKNSSAQLLSNVGMLPIGSNNSIHQISLSSFVKETPKS